MSDEQVTPENVESKHALRETPETPETPEVHDPADDYKVPSEIPDPHDDVDVALQDGKDTQDGQGDDPVPPADFVSYEDPSADNKEETN